MLDLAGLAVVVNRFLTRRVAVRLTWRERWWRPWQSHRIETQDDGQCYQWGYMLICSPLAYKNLTNLEPPNAEPLSKL